MFTKLKAIVKRRFSLRRFAWTGLAVCLIVASWAVGHQLYIGEPIDVPAIAFGFAGIIAAIFALLITESTLKQMDERVETQTKRLSDQIDKRVETQTKRLSDQIDKRVETQTKRLSDQIDNLNKAITNLEDATRKGLNGFAEIFGYALRLLNEAQEEIWYVN